jgi:endonuclease-8
VAAGALGSLRPPVLLIGFLPGARDGGLGDDWPMPEGDAVRRTAARLDAALAGAELTWAELRVPRFATVQLRGMTVLGTHVHGKHMLTRLADESRAWTLHHHLRMDGTWRTGPPGPPGAPRHHIRVWLVAQSAQAVGVRVHMVEVRPSAEERLWIGHLGPDVMDEGFDPAGAAQVLAEAGRPLVEALLDQRLVSGLGTMWAAELAAAARAHPMAPSAEVQDLPAALTGIAARMQRAVVQRDPRRQRAELRVFERTGQPCRVCGTPIRAMRVGVAPMDRPTYWCQTCQPLLSGR